MADMGSESGAWGQIPWRPSAGGVAGCGCYTSAAAFIASTLDNIWQITVTKTMENSHYQRIGGEAAVRALVQRFYQLMDNLPDAAEIRAMHARNLKGSEEKLFLFLSGWLGGPPLYVENYGHPRLRQRHMPFPIDERARDQWMACMRQAMADVGIEEGLRQELDAAFYKVADFMRNRM